MGKINYKKSVKLVIPKAKSLKTPLGYFVIITGNIRNHSVHSKFTDTISEAWESAYRKIENDKLYPKQ